MKHISNNQLITLTLIALYLYDREHRGSERLDEVANYVRAMIKEVGVMAQLAKQGFSADNDLDMAEGVRALFDSVMSELREIH